MNIKLTIEAPQLAEAISKLADALQGGLPSAVLQDSQKKAEKKTVTKKQEPLKEEPEQEEPEVTDEPELVEPEPEETDEPEVIDLKTVRAYLQKLNDAGRQKEAKGIISSMGFTKLSDIPEDRRADVVEKVKELLADE